MQCTSFTPVYYHARDLNLGASGYSWHLYDSNASYGDGGYNISMPPCNRYSVYDKEVLKQIIQNHEATFRFQVQELHRLYRRQRDLMDETRMREMFTHHLLSRTSESFHSLSRAEFSQNHSPASNWLFGDLASNKLSDLTSGNIRGCKSTFAEKFEEHTTIRSNNVQFLSPGCKQTGTELVNLELRKQFQVGDHSEVSEVKCRTSKEISSFQPDFTSISTLDFSSSGSSDRKANCFIDLNEPIQLDALEAFTGHDKMVSSNECVPVKAVPESIVPTQPQLMKSDDSSADGVNSSMAIDLNSMPLNCYYETDITLESPRSEDELKKSDNFLKAETHIDLNTDLEGKHSLPLSSSTLQIKQAEDTELKGPVSPENEESSPPRGKSEDIQLSSEQGEGEPFIEVDAIAAQTLLNMVANFRHLYWFAEFVSSTGDDLENSIMELENDLCVENTLNSPHSSKAKGTGTRPRRSVKGQKRGKKGECLKASQMKRKASKNGCAKPRKCSKSSLSEVTKKLMSSILKQSAASMEQGFLQSWGKMRKREGGRRRRVSNSFLIAE